MAATLHSVDTQHGDMIHDAQLDYYGKRLATASSDKTVRVFDVSGPTHVHIATLGGHEGPVWEVSWAHPSFGTLLASCSYDRQVVIHREEPAGSWSLIHCHRDHKSSVNSVAWGPHEFGLVLACASSDGTFSVIQHSSDNEWRSLGKVADCSMGTNAISWAPYHHLSTHEGEMCVATAGCDNMVRIWRCQPRDGPEWQRQVLEPAVHTDWVRDVAWVPSGGLPFNMLASASEDGTVAIWKQTTAGGEWTHELLPKFDAPVWRVSWSITGSILACSSGDNSVTLWKENLSGRWQQISSVADAAGEVPASAAHAFPPS